MTIEMYCWDISCSIMTMLQLDDRGSIPGRDDEGCFYFRHRVQTSSGTLSTGVKRSEREADHTPPSSAEAKNAWSYTSISSYVFIFVTEECSFY